MIEKFNNFTITRPRLRKALGFILVIYGFLALITPFTPGGLLLFVGLEILGIRFIFADKIKHFFLKEKKATPLITPPTQEKSL